MGTWDRVAARLGEEPDLERPAEGTLGLGRTFMLWLAANMVVTTLLTGTLFVPGIPYLTALVVIVCGTLVGVSILVLVHDRYAHRDADDGPDAGLLRAPGCLPAFDFQPRRPHGLELGSGRAGGHHPRLRRR